VQRVLTGRQDSLPSLSPSLWPSVDSPSLGVEHSLGSLISIFGIQIEMDKHDNRPAPETLFNSSFIRSRMICFPFVANQIDVHATITPATPAMENAIANPPEVEFH
jgi:hypothetical protein